jgi:hypothetical protein
MPSWQSQHGTEKRIATSCFAGSPLSAIAQLFIVGAAALLRNAAGEHYLTCTGLHDYCIVGVRDPECANCREPACCASAGTVRIAAAPPETLAPR